MKKLGIVLPKGMKKAGKGLVDEVKTCGGACAKKLEVEGSALPSDLEFIKGLKEQELRDAKGEVEKKLNIPFEERACEFCSCTGDALTGLSKEEFADLEKEIPEFADFVKRAYTQGFCKNKKESESCVYLQVEKDLNDWMQGIIDAIT